MLRAGPGYRPLRRSKSERTMDPLARRPLGQPGLHKRAAVWPRLARRMVYQPREV